jgi:hypothetical protein
MHTPRLSRLLSIKGKLQLASCFRLWEIIAEAVLCRIPDVAAPLRPLLMVR